MDGGEAGHDCGVVYHKLSIVFAGAAPTRRLCTPLMDLSHIGSVHFWFSFGTHLCLIYVVNKNISSSALTCYRFCCVTFFCGDDDYYAICNQCCTMAVGSFFTNLYLCN